ncbi:MAG: pilus assembly protein [Desulfovibrio sp.]|jgi:type IVB pilus formation R64 PilN family outer membrane protein|nr:pilus assembly protein [Desulfovibrio sp.]
MRNYTKYVSFILVLLFIFMSGCANKDAPTVDQVTDQGNKLKALSRSRVIDVSDDSYLGARAMSSSDTALNLRVTLRRKGALSEIAESISEMTRVTVQVSATIPESLKPGDPDPIPGLPNTILSVSYEGPLRGLLDQLSAQSGFGWDYNATTNTIIFARLMVRTFTLLGAPGEIAYNNQITNKSKENSGNRLSGVSGVGQTASTEDTSVQTSQDNTTKLKFDIWKDTEAVVKSMLSKNGSVATNQAAGTLTVRDNPDNMRQIGAVISDINNKLIRQVALNVQVWALEVTDDGEAGLDLQAIFRNDDVSIVAGSLATLGRLNTASATIVSGKLKDSTGVLKALKQWGKATQVTSGGGVIMNNQPVPVQAVKRHAYLAGASLNTTEYGQTSGITPGEVTSGFSMTVVPHILDKRRLILQYNVSLTALDDMEEFKTESIVVQLPQVSQRAFSQRTHMQMGQTLVLAGFAQQTQSTNTSTGLLSLGRSANYVKMLLVITIEVESATMEN